MHELSKTSEGDVNYSSLRAAWQKSQLSAQTLDVLAKDEKYFLKQALSTPCLNVASAVDGVYIVDEDSRKILDFHGNSAHQLGYNHPKLLAALQQQIQLLSFSPRRYANQAATVCAKKLCSLMPGDCYKALFTTSGAVSNEVALKLARIKTGKSGVLAAENSFHGATFYTISVGGTAHFRDCLSPLVDHCYHYPHYSSYQGDDKIGENAIAIIESLLQKHEIGAFIAEPIRCTDVQIPPIHYWQRIRELCNQYNVALIFDEIPTAFGRTGKMFAFEHYGIAPDMITLGKGMGGSLVPFSAVLAKDDFDIADSTSMGHFTHEKNPLASAICLALINEIEENRLCQRANDIGEYMKKRALSLSKRSDYIGDVRQVGALIGVELVKNKTSKEKAGFLAEAVLYSCLTLGLSFKVSEENVLTLSPPLTINDEELGAAMDILDTAILDLQ